MWYAKIMHEWFCRDRIGDKWNDPNSPGFWVGLYGTSIEFTFYCEGFDPQ
jgi:hypothetical protein